MAKLPIAGLGVLVLRVQGARDGHVDGERVGRLAVADEAGCCWWGWCRWSGHRHIQQKTTWGRVFFES